MNPKRNYQQELETLIETIKEGTVPKLLLHGCCAPCSSYCLSYLAEYFQITLFYYNPNISTEEEYNKRLHEVKRLIGELPQKYPITLLELGWHHEDYVDVVKGLEGEPEGGARCAKCFRLRLEKAAQMAKEGHFDYFTTTLTISPLKNATLLNTIGEEVGQLYGVPHLPSDFKKKDGYKKSCELSQVYGLYRQDYCGCEYSMAEREKKKEQLGQG